ncbi:virB8 family protein [Sphingomonas sp. BK069]|uniref:virB8 family protein n=1 Tax=Sphingomonas sp. BK069 TaxID=2586979 RepID=UPI001612252E|nr:VirB8/TrbF family protein [Sphingomonas sp. BK069]MBB3348716.1 type IV secretion system protein VirB8 [Sphingomonas sp. BK069]
MPPASAQPDHLAHGASWAQDRRDALFRSRRTAWLVAAAATVVAVCEALALVALLPLKTVVPYTLMVDRQTGYVQALKPFDAERVVPDRALTQSLLVQYVIAREGFDVDTVQSDYRKVGLWSVGQARADYLTAMQASDPASPLALYPRTTVVAVEVKSVTPLGSGVALVRYDTRRRDVGGTLQPARPWVAVIRYGFSGEPLSTADRFVNPLGFQVRRYRRSEEALPASAAPGAAPTVPPTMTLP